MNPPSLPIVSRLHRAAVFVGFAAVVLSTAACDDDPFNFNDWTSAPDTVLLYSLDRPELNLPSAYAFNRRTLHEVEAANSSGLWDVALDTREGRLVLLPPRALGVDGEAGIAPLPNEDYETIREAPADTAAYVSAAAVPVVVGQLYVVRTNESLGGFGQRCTYYAKMQPLEADVQLGTLRFRLDSNPICNNRDLVPPAN